MSESAQNYEHLVNLKINDPEEILRKLKLLCRYEKDDNMMKMEDLTDKWKCAARHTLGELCSLSQDPVTELELLKILGIEPEMIGFHTTPT